MSPPSGAKSKPPVPSNGSIFPSGVFFFQAEDGIRDYKVTGVQTCALPIFQRAGQGAGRAPGDPGSAQAGDRQSIADTVVIRWRLLALPARASSCSGGIRFQAPSGPRSCPPPKRL